MCGKSENEYDISKNNTSDNDDDETTSLDHLSAREDEVAYVRKNKKSYMVLPLLMNLWGHLKGTSKLTLQQNITTF